MWIPVGVTRVISAEMTRRCAASETFARNLAGAQAAGLVVGAYHFFTFCRPGAEQAANFLKAVPRDRPMLPPAVDVEFVGNCEARPAVADPGFDRDLIYVNNVTSNRRRI